MALVVGAFLSFGAIALAQGDTCPDGGGWTKFDSASGTETLDFGTLTWGGNSLDYVVFEGWKIELCLKYATLTDFHEITGFAKGTLVTGDGRNISHISYRVLERPVVIDETLVVTKDARASYDRTVTWGLDKSVNPASHAGQAGDSFESTWTVDATKTETVASFFVTGDITIFNPAPASVTFTVDDRLDDGTVASVRCPKLTIGENETVVCTYTASPQDDSATLNTANVVVTDVVWDSGFTGTVVGDTASATVSFVPNVIGDELVTLDDDRNPEGFPVDIRGDFSVDYGERFECPADGGLYEDGRYSFTVPNTATLKGRVTDLSATASVSVECVLPALEVEKTADASFDRTIEWALDKSVDPGRHAGFAGDVFGSTWTVEATKSESLGNYLVSGVITITNPAGVPQAFELEDIMTGASEDLVPVRCEADVVPARGQVFCRYQLAVAGAELNTVTVTAAGNDPVVATARVVYVENVIGDELVTLDDDRNPEGFPVDIRGDFSVDYGERFVCPTDRDLYGDDFLYEETFVNTATLVGAETLLRARATVTLVCELVGELTVSKTVDTSYTITHEWDIEKGVSTDDGFKLDGTPKIWLYIDGEGDETATWTVDVTYVGAEESDFTVSGVITIANTGDLPADIASVDDLGMAITDCELDGASFAIPGRLNPEETITCAYSIDLDEKVDGDNFVVVEGEFANGEPFGYTVTAPYSFDDADVTEFFATVAVKDVSDLFGEVELGTVSAPDDAQFTYSEDFAWEDYGADGCGSFTYGNIATIVETEQSANATLKVNVQCYVDETAYAKGDDAICFIPTFAQWGWTNPIEPSSYTWDLWAGAAQCDTSRGTLVGTVTVDYNDGGLSVEFNLEAPNLRVESHVYAGSTEFPQQRRGRRTVNTVAPGQYYIEDGLSGEIYVIVHAVVAYPDPNFGP